MGPPFGARAGAGTVDEGYCRGTAAQPRELGSFRVLSGPSPKGRSGRPGSARVVQPLAFPAIVASAVLVFADVIDDFVIVRYLSGGSTTEPVSVKIYNTARAAPTPALNAIATLVLVASLLAVFLGYLAYRRMTRGEDERAVGIDAFTGEA